MNKEQLTSHIKDIELKQSIKKILDICEQSIHSHTIKHSKFLMPNQTRILDGILHLIDDTKYEFFAPNNEAERQIVYFYPTYMQMQDYSDISIVSIQPCEKELLSHRDYLGTIISLGIDREIIGDIIISDDIAYAIILKPLDIFLVNNLQKVKNVKVKVKIQDNLPKIEKKIEEIKVNISSLRLDAIIASLARLSREKSQVLISSGDVKVNFIECKNNSKILEPMDIISIRRFGKYKIQEIVSETKKKRIWLKILKYSN